MQLEEALEKYSQYLEIYRAPGTRELYVRRLGVVTKAIGAKTTEEITTDGFERYAREAIKTLAPTSINGDLRIAKAFLSWLRSRKFIKHSGLDGAVPLPDPRDPKRRALTEEEVKKLIKSGKRKLLWEFLISTGLRRGELSQLKRKDVDLVAGIVRVRPSTVKGRKRERNIPLTMALRRKLEKYWNGAVPTDPAFCTNRRTPVGHGLRRQLKRDLEEVGVDATGVDVHALRQTFATRLVHRGVDPRTVQALMGHASVTITMGIYANYVAQSSEQTMRGLEMPE